MTWGRLGVAARVVLTLALVLVAFVIEDHNRQAEIELYETLGGFVVFVLVAALVERYRSARALSYVAVLGAVCLLLVSTIRQTGLLHWQSSEQDALPLYNGKFDSRLPRFYGAPPGTVYAFQDSIGNVVFAFEMNGASVPPDARGRKLIEFAKSNAPAELEPTWGETILESSTKGLEGARTRVEVTLVFRRYVGWMATARTEEKLHNLFILSPANRPDQLEPLVKALEGSMPE